MVNEGHIRQILAVLRAEYGNKVLIDEPRIKLWMLVLGHATFAEEEGAKLPPEALRAIGGTTGLRELACTNPENIGVIRAQFRQRLEARKSVDQFEATNAHITALLDKQPIKRIQ